MGSQIRGIDAVAKKNNQFIICEAKGTTLSHSTVSQHLKKTKTKGRQLSWNWIWASLIDFAEDARNANLFLELYDHVILQENIERRLYISRLKKIKRKYVILSTECYYHKDFKHLNKINAFDAKNKLKKWLDEM